MSGDHTLDYMHSRYTIRHCKEIIYPGLPSFSRARDSECFRVGTSACAAECFQVGTGACAAE